MERSEGMSHERIEPTWYHSPTGSPQTYHRLGHSTIYEQQPSEL